MSYKVIVAGGRDFRSEEIVFDLMDQLHEANTVVEVVCGEARGADKLGRKWAESRGIAVASFPADWDSNGKAAGYIRNTQMGDYADLLIAFWDGKSRGTKHMIDCMTKLPKTVLVYDYYGNLRSHSLAKEISWDL